LRKLMLRFVLIVFAVLTVSSWPTSAQQNKAAAPDTVAPIPLQIGSAKKVFIANAGGECSPFGQVGFSGGPDVAYNEFYAGMKQWDRLTLVNGPTDADLVMEVHFTCPIYFDGNLSRVDAQLRVTFLDPKSRILLWAITEHSQSAMLKGNRDKEFGIAMSKLISDVKTLVILAADQPEANK
jgi:hypothetical protein